MQRIRKHARISTALAEEICAGKYAVGARIAGEEQLARRFKVSRPTVRRAIGELRARGLLESRFGSGTYVRGTFETPHAHTLRNLGLIVPDLKHTEIFEAICGELGAMARSAGFGLLWGGILSTRADDYDMSAEQAEAFVGQLIQSRAEGVFFVPFEHRADSAEINARIAGRLHRAGVAVVLIDRDIVPFPNRSAFDMVEIDNFGGGYALARHLLKSGARRLGFVSIPHTASTVSARIAGAQSAILAHGAGAAPLEVFQGNPLDAKFVRAIVRGRKIDGVMCTSDHVAAQFLQTASRAGVRIPHDVRLTGFDDTPVAAMLSVPLTTMAQPCRDIAAVAFRAMLARIERPSFPPSVRRLSSRLVVRESAPLSL